MSALISLSWPLRTPRLLVRPPVSADLDEIWAYRRIASVQQWQGRSPTNRDEWVAAFANRMQSRLVIEFDQHVVGDLVVEVGDPWSQYECRDLAAGSQADLAWTLHPAHSRRGYATEAVRAVIGACFDPVPRGLGLRRVTAGCFVSNEASWRLMESLTMRRERRGIRDYLHRERGWLDSFTYALLAEDWSS